MPMAVGSSDARAVCWHVFGTDIGIWATRINHRLQVVVEIIPWADRRIPAGDTSGRVSTGTTVMLEESVGGVVHSRHSRTDGSKRWTIVNLLKPVAGVPAHHTWKATRVVTGMRIRTGRAKVIMYARPPPIREPLQLCVNYI